MTWSRVVAAGLEPATSTTYKIGALPAELRNQVDGPRSVEQGSECDPGSGRNRTCEFGPLVSGVRLFRGAGPAGRRGRKGGQRVRVGGARTWYTSPNYVARIRPIPDHAEVPAESRLDQSSNSQLAHAKAIPRPSWSSSISGFSALVCFAEAPRPGLMPPRHSARLAGVRRIRSASARRIATSPSSARSCCSWRSASAYRSGKTSSTCAQRR